MINQFGAAKLAEGIVQEEYQALTGDERLDITMPNIGFVTPALALTFGGIYAAKKLKSSGFDYQKFAGQFSQSLASNKGVNPMNVRGQVKEAAAFRAAVKASHVSFDNRLGSVINIAKNRQLPVKHVEAARYSFYEIMSRPQIQQALAMKGMDFNEVIGGIDRIAKSDRRLLYQEMHKVFEVVKQFDPNVESEFFKSVIGRERSRSFTKKYHGNVKTVDPAKYGKNNLAAANSVRTISDFNEFRNLEGTSKLKNMFTRLRSQNLVSGSFDEFSQTLMNEGRVFAIERADTNAAYARLNIKGKEFNFPLKRNTKLLANGATVPIYHPDAIGRNTAAPVSKIVKLNKRTSGMELMDWEEALFWGKGKEVPYIDEMLKTTRGSMERALVGSKDNAADVSKYLQYFTDTAQGQTSAHLRSTLGGLMGLEDYMKAHPGLSAQSLFARVEEVVNKEGYDAFGYASPGQTGKIGAFQMFKKGEMGSSAFGMYSDPENFAGIRRPGQMLSEPWRMTDASRASALNKGIRLGDWRNNDFIYNPVKSPLIDTPIYRKMLDTGMAAYVAPILYSRKSGGTLMPKNLPGFTGLEEGEIGILKGQAASMPDYEAISKVHRIHKPNAKILKSEAHNAIVDLDLFSIADANINDTAARRAAIAERLKNNRTDWKNGMYLGLKMDPQRGLVEEKISVGGAGKLDLVDVISHENEYRLVFQRSEKMGETTKVYGDLKGQMRIIDPSLEGIRGSLANPDFANIAQLYGEGKEVIRSGNYSRLRSQQASGLRYQLAAKLGHFSPEDARPGIKGSIPKASYKRMTNALRALTIGEGSESVFERLEKAGSPLMQEFESKLASINVGSATAQEQAIGSIKEKMGSSAYKRQMSQLFGMMGLTEGLNEKEIAEVFGWERFEASRVSGEKYMFGELGAILENKELAAVFDANLGAGTSSLFTRALATDTEYIIGEATMMARGSGAAYPNSRPSIERRALEALFYASDDSFVQMAAKGNTTYSMRKAMLDDIAFGIERPNENYMSAIERIKSAYGSVDKQTSIITSDVGQSVFRQVESALEGSGGFVDVGSMLGEKPGTQVAYLPSKMVQTTVSPGLAIGEEVISQDYPNVLNQFKRAVNEFEMATAGESKEAAKSQLKQAYSDLRATEAGMFHDAAISKGMGGKIAHSTYQLISSNTVDAMQDVGEGMVTTRGQGMVTLANKKKIQELYFKAMEVNPYDKKLKSQLQRELKDILSNPGKVTAIRVQRSPTITERGNQVLGLAYSPELDEIDRPVLQAGRRFKKIGDKLVNFNPLLAAANSHDYDGDHWVVNLLMGKRRNTVIKNLRSETFLKEMAQDTDRIIAMHSALDTAMDQRMNTIFDGQMTRIKSSNFVDDITKLYGQKEIGMLSYQLDTLKYAARAGVDSGSANALTRANYDMLEKATYVLEQRGVSFKHAESGKTAAVALSEDLSRVTRASNVEMGTEALKDTLVKWFGDDVVGKGISYEMPTGGSGVIKFDESFFNQMKFPVAIANTPELRAVHDFASKTSSEIADMGHESIQRKIASVVGAAEINSIDSFGSWIAQEMSTAPEGPGAGKRMAESWLTMLNRRVQESGIVENMGNNRKVAAAALGGLTVAAGIYTLFDRGYDSTPLQAPVDIQREQIVRNMKSEGRFNEAAALQGQWSKENNFLASDFMGQANKSQDAVAIEPAARVSYPSSPNSIPTRSLVTDSTGRIGVNGTIPDSIDPNLIAERYRASMGHSQVGVSVKHNYRVPRDLGSQL